MAGKKQFDIDDALDRAMLTFWRRGFADASLADLTAATGLNRSSLYGTFGGKDALFRQCLDRYARRYGDLYDAALAPAAERPVAAITAFFEVTLGRIADPDVPDGCLVAQSTMAVPVLPRDSRQQVVAALDAQCLRLRSALSLMPLEAQDVDDLALHLAAVNQALAVMSRGGVSSGQLRGIVGVAVSSVSQALNREAASTATVPGARASEPVPVDEEIRHASSAS